MCIILCLDSALSFTNFHYYYYYCNLKLFMLCCCNNQPPHTPHEQLWYRWILLSLATSCDIFVWFFVHYEFSTTSYQISLSFFVLARVCLNFREWYWKCLLLVRWNSTASFSSRSCHGWPESYYNYALAVSGESVLSFTLAVNYDVGLHDLGCQVDILRTNCYACRFWLAAWVTYVHYW